MKVAPGVVHLCLNMSRMIASNPFGLELFVTAQYPMGSGDDIQI